MKFKKKGGRTLIQGTSLNSLTLHMQTCQLLMPAWKRWTFYNKKRLLVYKTVQTFSNKNTYEFTIFTI